MTSLEHNVMTSDGMQLSIVCNTSLTRQERVTSLDDMVTLHGELNQVRRCPSSVHPSFEDPLYLGLILFHSFIWRRRCNVLVYENNETVAMLLNPKKGTAY